LICIAYLTTVLVSLYSYLVQHQLFFFLPGQARYFARMMWTRARRSVASFRHLFASPRLCASATGERPAFPLRTANLIWIHAAVSLPFPFWRWCAQLCC
jgi:hypothetical protein